MSFTETSIFKLAEMGEIDKVIEKLYAGEYINTKDEYGGTVLVYAVQSGSLELVDYLISNGADVILVNDYVSAQGETVLHYAANSGSLELVKELVEYLSTDYRYYNDLNSVLNAVDQNGETALHYAAELGSYEVVLYLVYKGIEISTKNNWGETAHDIAKAKEHNYSEIVKYLSQLRAQSL